MQSQSSTLKANNASTLVQQLEKASADLTTLIVDLDVFHTNFIYVHYDKTLWQPSIEAIADRSDNLLVDLKSLKHEVNSRNKHIKNQWSKLRASARACNARILYYFSVNQHTDELPDETKKAIKSILTSIQSNEFNCKNDDWCQQDIYFLFELQATLIENAADQINLVALLEVLIEMSNKNFLRMRMFGNIISLAIIHPPLLYSMLTKYAANLESTTDKINSLSSSLAEQNNLDIHGKAQQANANMLAYEFLYLHRYLQYINNHRGTDIQLVNLCEKFQAGYYLGNVMPVPEKITEPELKALLENEAVLRARYYIPALNLMKSIDFNSMQHHHATQALLHTLAAHATGYAMSMRNFFQELLYKYNHKKLKLSPILAKTLSERTETFNTLTIDWEKITRAINAYLDKLIPNSKIKTKLSKELRKKQSADEFFNRFMMIESRVSISEERYQWKLLESSSNKTLEDFKKDIDKQQKKLKRAMAKKAKKEEAVSSNVQPATSDEDETEESESNSATIISVSEIENDHTKLLEFYNNKTLALAKSLQHCAHRISKTCRERYTANDPLPDEQWEDCVRAFDSTLCDFESLIKLRNKYYSLRTTIDKDDLQVLDCFEFSIDYLDRLINNTQNDIDEARRMITMVDNKLQKELKTLLLHFGSKYMQDHDITGILPEKRMLKFGWRGLAEHCREKRSKELTETTRSNRAIERILVHKCTEEIGQKIEELKRATLAAMSPATAAPIPTLIKLTYCAHVILPQDERNIPGYFNQLNELPGQTFLASESATEILSTKMKPKDFSKNNLIFVNTGINPGDALTINNTFHISKHNRSLCKLKTKLGKLKLYFSDAATAELSMAEWMLQKAYRQYFTAFGFLIDSDGNVHDLCGRGFLDLNKMHLVTMIEPNAALVEDPVCGLFAIDNMLRGFTLDAQLDTALNHWQPSKDLNRTHLIKVATAHLLTWKPENRLKYVGLLMHYDLLNKMFGICTNDPQAGLDALETLAGLRMSSQLFTQPQQIPKTPDAQLELKSSLQS